MNKIQKIDKSEKLFHQKIESQLDLLLDGQKLNQHELRLGFIGLAKQNHTQELSHINKEREEKELRKQARANQKRLPKRDPMTAQIYKELILEALIYM